MGQVYDASLLTQEAYKEAKATAGAIITGMSHNSAQVYLKAVNHAAARVGVVGEKAMREAVQMMAAEGVHAYTYTRKDGTMVRVPADVGIRRAVYTAGRSRLNDQTLAVAAETRHDLIEVNATRNCRPSHELIDGKVFSLSGSDPKYPKWDSACDACLHDYNCGHSIRIFNERLGRRFGTAMARTDAAPLEERRELVTQQRALENRIRKQKRTVDALKAAGQDTKEANARLNATRAQLRDLIAANPKVLYRERHREQVYDSAASMANLAAKKQKIADLTSEIAKHDKDIASLTKRIDALEQQTYVGVWRNPVTVKDYGVKKDAIQAKYKYFKAEMAKLDPSSAEYKKLDGYFATAKKYNRDGYRYEKMLAQRAAATSARKAAQDEIARLQGAGKAKPQSGLTALQRRYADAYTEERKNAALDYTERQKKSADKYLRVKAGEVWRESDRDTRDALYGYTAGSGRYNRPLSGFEKPWSDSGSGWEEKYFKGVDYVWIDFEDSGDDIRRMTKALERSGYDKDMWLNRGCDLASVESLLEIKRGTLEAMSNADLQQFIGKDGRINSFVSTGAAKGTGFTTKRVRMRIYAPEGSEMIYAEPFSSYGNGDGKGWDGTSKQSSLGSEFEVIIQRGGSYTVTDMQWNGYTLEVTLEHHPERGYNKFQQDDSDWTGSRKKFK